VKEKKKPSKLEIPKIKNKGSESPSGRLW